MNIKPYDNRPLLNPCTLEGGNSTPAHLYGVANRSISAM